MAGPFDYVKSITYTKEDIMTDGSDYTPWIINRALGLSPDTVFHAQEASKMYNLSNRMQYDFLINFVRKRKRFQKWPTIATDDRAELVAAYYGISLKKARESLCAISDEHYRQIEEDMCRGGVG